MNIFKAEGYHQEHNFGHGREYLAALLLSLNQLAFLFHKVVALLDEQYRANQQKLGLRRSFFQELDALLRYLAFSSWDKALDFMSKCLELDTE